MYRILIATSGSYYVQKQTAWGWSKRGGFFNTRAGARRLISDLKNNECQGVGRVVEYV